MLVKVVRRVSYPYMGYLFLLLACALLGLFVVALAYRSGWAAVVGVALGGSLVAVVAGFRKGAVKLAQSRREGDPRHNVSIFSEPLSQEEVDQYYANYRGGIKPECDHDVAEVGPNGTNGDPNLARLKRRINVGYPLQHKVLERTRSGYPQPPLSLNWWHQESINSAVAAHPYRVQRPTAH